MATSVPIHTDFNLPKEFRYFQSRLQSTMTDLGPWLGLHFKCVSISSSLRVNSRGSQQRNHWNPSFSGHTFPSLPYFIVTGPTTMLPCLVSWVVLHSNWAEVISSSAKVEVLPVRFLTQMSLPGLAEISCYNMRIFVATHSWRTHFSKHVHTPCFIIWSQEQF